MLLVILVQCYSNDRLRDQDVQKAACPFFFLWFSLKKQRQRLYGLGNVEVECVDLLCDIEQVTSQVPGLASKARSSRHPPHNSFKLIKCYEICGQNCNSLVKFSISDILPHIGDILYISGFFLFFFSEPDKLISAVDVTTGRLPVGGRYPAQEKSMNSFDLHGGLKIQPGHFDKNWKHF